MARSWTWTWPALCLGLLIGALGAASASSGFGSSWKPRSEYRYELNGRSFAGLPSLQGQYSGVRYGGRVRVQGLTADTVLMRMEDFWWAPLHARLQSGWWSTQPLQNQTFPGNDNSKQELRLAGSSAVVRFQDGQVKSILVGKSVADWEINLLQGVVAQMQVQSGSEGGNSLHGHKHQQTDKEVFHVMESSVSGRCEVLYEIAATNPPLQISTAGSKMCEGKDYIQITKTRNFTNCEQLVEETRGTRCSRAGNLCGTFWARNSMTQIIGCGSEGNFQLVQSVSSGGVRALLQLREDSQAAEVNSLNLTLHQMGPVRERLPTPKDGTLLPGLGYRVKGERVFPDVEEDGTSDEEDSASDSVEVVSHKKKSKKYESESDDDSSQNHYRKHKKNGKSSSESESDSIEIKETGRRHQKHKYGDDSSDQSGKSEDRKHRKSHKSRDSNESHDSNESVRSAFGKHSKKHAKNHGSYNSQESDESVKHSGKHKLSRHRRSNRSNRKAHGNNEAAFHSDLLAGALSPYSVQANSSLLSHVQRRVVELIQDAAVELVRPEGPNSQTMERLGMAVRLARSLTSEQLRKVQDTLKGKDDQWELFRDVVSFTGSEAGVSVALDWIKERKVSSVSAQQMLSNLHLRIPKPTISILKQVQSVYSSARGEEGQAVQVASALALGELAARAQWSEAASFLAEQMKSQDAKAPLRAALTWALGATASPHAIDPLIQEAKSTKLPAYQRAQAVLALKDCAFRFPARVQDSLLALYHGPLNPAPVRMAAVSLMVYMRPSVALWQRLAVSTWYETNPAVASYVWSTVHSFAQLKDPHYALASKMARAALPLARSSPQGLHLAFNTVAASVDAMLDRMAHEHAIFFAPVDGSNIYYRRVTRSAGESVVDSEFDLWASNPDDLVQSAMKSVFGWKDDRQTNRPPQKNVPHSTRSIHNALNIVARHLPESQGRLRLTLLPFLRNLYLPFNKDTPNYFAKAAAKLADEARSGKNFKFQQMGGKELSLSTVSEMGFPISLRLQTPWVLRTAGKLYVHRNNMAQANINFVLASGLTAQLAMQPSWGSREYVAGVRGHMLLSTPSMSLRAQANTTEGCWRASGEAMQGVEGEGAARITAQPYTASLELTQAELPSLAAAVQNATNARASPQRVQLSSWDSLSMSMQAPVKLAALPAWLQESRPVLGFPILGPSLTASRLDVMLARPDPFNVSFSLVKAMSQNGNLDVVFPETMKWNESLWNSGESSSSSMTTTTESTSTSGSYSTSTESPVTTTMSSPVNYNADQIGYTSYIRPMRSPRSHFENGSYYTDSGDIDLSVEALNSSTVNPYVNRVNGSSELYLLTQTLAGMSGGRGYVVGMNLTTSDAKSSYSAFWTYGSSLAGKLTRVGLFARNNQDDSQVATTAALYADIAPAVSVSTALGADREVMINADFVKTESNAAKAVITAFVDTGRSLQLKRRLWSQAQEQGCIRAGNASKTCINILNVINTPDQYNVTLNYNDVAQNKFEYISNFAWEAVKAHLWNEGNVAVNVADNGVANEIKVGISAQTGRTFDGWVKTPHSLTQVVGAAVPPQILLFKYTAPKEAFCSASSNKLHTLDGMDADIELDECWHLLAKDCSGKSRVAVLARSKPGDSSALQVEVNIDNYQIALFSPEGASLNGVSLNDMQPAQSQVQSQAKSQGGSTVEVRDAADVRVMRITRASDGAQVVALPDHGVTVVYGNSSVIVQAGNSLRGRLCGMCGNFDGSTYGEWRNPQDKLEKSAQAFTNSYKLDCNKNHH